MVKVIKIISTNVSPDIYVKLKAMAFPKNVSQYMRDLIIADLLRVGETPKITELVPIEPNLNEEHNLVSIRGVT